jgi:hypothetical protein
MRFTTLLLVLTSLFVFNVHSTFAASSFGNLEIPFAGNTSVDKVAQGGFGSYFQLIVNYFIVGIIILGVIMIVVGGMMYMTDAGQGKQMETGKTFIKAAILGIILALTAYLILNTISGQFVTFPGFLSK